MADRAGMKRVLNKVFEALLPLLAVPVAFLIGAMMLLALGANPLEAYGAMIAGAFGDVSGLTQTLVKATPLLLVGLGVCIAFRGGVINIGGETEEAKKKELTKSDKPDVKVFVMSYCPYGLQAEKMYLPVYNLLKDKSTMGIYFRELRDARQKELDENLRQHCIQKEQSDKYAAYLECFTASTAAADGTVNPATCLAKAEVDKTKMNACMSATDAQFKITENYNNKETWLSGSYPTFGIHEDLNKQYNVQGSPTIVINDKDAGTALTARTPEAFKALICSTFNNEPERM